MNINPKVKKLIQEYSTVVKIMDKKAHDNNGRAYGGIVRSVKGKLQEHITEEIIKLAWQSVGGDNNRIKINSTKFKIPILKDYIIDLLISNGYYA